MDTKKQRVLLFGTGSGGKNGYDYLKSSHEVIGFCDNSKNKQGVLFCGLPTYAPEALSTLDFDRIVICSMYRDEIMDQLSVKLNIPHERIETLDHDVRIYGRGKPLVCLAIALTLLVAVGYAVCRVVSSLHRP